MKLTEVEFIAIIHRISSMKHNLYWRHAVDDKKLRIFTDGNFLVLAEAGVLTPLRIFNQDDVAVISFNESDLAHFMKIMEIGNEDLN